MRDGFNRSTSQTMDHLNGHPESSTETSTKIKVSSDNVCRILFCWHIFIKSWVVIWRGAIPLVIRRGTQAPFSPDALEHSVADVAGSWYVFFMWMYPRRAGQGLTKNSQLL